MQEAIDHVYLQREKPRLSDLLKEVERECRRKGLRVPNYRTIKRRVDAIDARESVRKRSGSKAANDRFRPTSVLSTADLLPLERVQIDRYIRNYNKTATPIRWIYKNVGHRIAPAAI